MPSVCVLSPAMLCPPDRTVTARPAAVAYRTAAATPDASRGRTTRSGVPVANTVAAASA